jgi:hypothetical protein
VLASVALVHEKLNPVLLAEGWTQDQADKVLAQITTDLRRAAEKAKPHERADIARAFALRCISEYRDGGHVTH